MHVAQRIELLLQHEHKQLTDFLPVTNEVVANLRPPAVDKKAEAKAEAARARGQAAPPPPRAWSPRAIHEAWKAFHEKLLEHMKHERDVVLPLIIRVTRDHDIANRETLRGWIQFMQAEHAQLRRLAGVLRVETMPTEAAGVRRKVLDVLELFEAHTRIEELEIFPAADGAETPVASKRTSENIMRTLRHERPDVKDEATEEVEVVGLFGRLKGLFGR